MNEESLNAAAASHTGPELNHLSVPPGNRLEALKGNRKGLHSIRINDQWAFVSAGKRTGRMKSKSSIVTDPP